MRLKRPNEYPAGGFYYVFQGPDGHHYHVEAKEGGLSRLVHNTRLIMVNNNIEPPSDLRNIIEDQICTRQPPGSCYYTKGAGDQVAKHIHNVARSIDNLASKFGISSKLEKKARGCSKCAQRRMKLNKLS